MSKTYHFTPLCKHSADVENMTKNMWKIMNAKWHRRENTNTPHVFLQISIFFHNFHKRKGEKREIAVKGKEIEKHKLLFLLTSFLWIQSEIELGDFVLFHYAIPIQYCFKCANEKLQECFKLNHREWLDVI